MTTEEVAAAVKKFHEYLKANGVRTTALLVQANDSTHCIGYPDAIERSFLDVIANQHSLKVVNK